MKILYVTNFQGDSVVAQRHQRRNRTLGPSRKVELLARGLGRRGHEVELVSAATVSEGSCRWYPGFVESPAEGGGVRVEYLGGLDVPRLNLLVASWQLRRYLAKAQAQDVVLLYNLEWYFLAPVVEYCRRVGAPLVIEYEDDALAPVGARLESWHVSRGHRSIARAAGMAAGVVAVSPELARQLAVANAAVLPGLVGDDILAIPCSTWEKDAPLRLVYTGGITREKGPDILLEAVDRLEFPAEVDIVGVGRDSEELRARAARCGVPTRLHGEVDRESLVRILGRAHVAVNPHRMPKGRAGQIFPFKVVEYMGAGLPVVSSPLGEFPVPEKGSLVTYLGDDPSLLAKAITEARGSLGDLRLAAARARAWVAENYSAGGAAGMVEQVLCRAVGASQRRNWP